MTTILETQVVQLLTSELGRTPTAMEIAMGMVAPQTLAQIHNSLEAGQSIYAVSPGDDIQASIDKLDSNGGGTLYLQPGTFNVSNNISVPSNVHVQGVGSGGSIIDFGGGAYQIQVIGTSMVPNNSAFLQGFTVQNSSTDLIHVSYSNNFGGQDIACNAGNAGLRIDNSTIFNWNIHYVDSCTSGIIMDVVDGFTIQNAFMSNLMGTAYEFTAGNNGVLINSSLDTVGGDGVSIINSGNVGVDEFSIVNVVGVGFRLDSITGAFGATNGFISGCTSDAMRLQNTSMESIMSGVQFSSNTGFGVNITDSASADNLFIGNSFFNNTAGAFQDNGTNTLIRSNIGVADN